MTEKEDATKEPDKEPLDDKALEKQNRQKQVFSPIEPQVFPAIACVYHLLAVDELIQEAIQGAIRAEQQGPSGWIKAKPQPKTNKRFLVNTLRSTISSNNYHSSQSGKRRSSRSESSKRESKTDPTIKKDRSKRKH